MSKARSHRGHRHRGNRGRGRHRRQYCYLVEKCSLTS